MPLYPLVQGRFILRGVELGAGAARGLVLRREASGLAVGGVTQPCGASVGGGEGVINRRFSGRERFVEPDVELAPGGAPRGS